jgi:hypothetical protein
MYAPMLSIARALTWSNSVVPNCLTHSMSCAHTPVPQIRAINKPVATLDATPLVHIAAVPFPSLQADTLIVGGAPSLTESTDSRRGDRPYPDVVSTVNSNLAARRAAVAG